MSARHATGQSELSAVSCPAASWCTAVGFIESAVTYLPLAEHWNGARWAVQAQPSVAGQLTSISCPTTTVCEAVESAGVVEGYRA